MPSLFAHLCGAVAVWRLERRAKQEFLQALQGHRSAEAMTQPVARGLYEFLQAFCHSAEQEVVFRFNGFAVVSSSIWPKEMPMSLAFQHKEMLQAASINRKRSAQGEMAILHLPAHFSEEPLILKAPSGSDHQLSQEAIEGAPIFSLRKV